MRESVRLLALQGVTQQDSQAVVARARIHTLIDVEKAARTSRGASAGADDVSRAVDGAAYSRAQGVLGRTARNSTASTAKTASNTATVAPEQRIKHKERGNANIEDNKVCRRARNASAFNAPQE